MREYHHALAHTYDPSIILMFSSGKQLQFSSPSAGSSGWLPAGYEQFKSAQLAKGKSWAERGVRLYEGKPSIKPYTVGLHAARGTARWTVGSERLPNDSCAWARLSAVCTQVQMLPTFPFLDAKFNLMSAAASSLYSRVPVR
jgi:hypothetical protein